MRAGVVAVIGRCLARRCPAAPAAQGLDTTCQFSLTRLDASTTNVLAVDTNAVYWGGTYAGAARHAASGSRGSSRTRAT